MPQRIVTDEQQRNRPKMGLPEGPGHFWAATASLVAYDASSIAALLAPCFAPKLHRPVDHIISLRALSFVLACLLAFAPANLAQAKFFTSALRKSAAPETFLLHAESTGFSMQVKPEFPSNSVPIIGNSLQLGQSFSVSAQFSPHIALDHDTWFGPYSAATVPETDEMLSVLTILIGPFGPQSGNHAQRTLPKINHGKNEQNVAYIGALASAGSVTKQIYSALPPHSLADPNSAQSALNYFFDHQLEGNARAQNATVSRTSEGFDGLGSMPNDVILAPTQRQDNSGSIQDPPPPPTTHSQEGREGRPILPAIFQAASAGIIWALVLTGQLNLWLGLVILTGFVTAAWGMDRLMFQGYLGAGEKAKEMLTWAKDLTKSMAGILFLAPVLGAFLGPRLGRVLLALGLDPSVAAPILALDMGGYHLAKALALDPLAGIFNGVLVSSMLGATLVFTIPLALGLLRPEDKPFLAKGLAAGLVTIAPGAFIAGVFLMQLSAMQTLLLLAPTALFSALLFAALSLNPEKTVKGVLRFARLVQLLSYAGLAIGLAAPVLSGLGWDLGTTPVLETFGLIGSIVLAMAAAVPLIQLLLYWDWLKIPLRAASARFGINEVSATGLLTSLVVITPMLDMFSRMDPRGKVLNAAFVVSAAWIFLDHPVFLANVEPAYMFPMLAAKAAAGLLSLPVAWWVSRPVT